MQGPVAYGVKVEDRIRIRRGLKARVSGAAVTCQTRMGRETAIGSNGEIKCVALMFSFPVILLTIHRLWRLEAPWSAFIQE